MKLPNINWKLLTLAVVFGLIFSFVFAVVVYPEATHTVKEKIVTWIKTHIIDRDSLNTIIDEQSKISDENVIVDGHGTGLGKDSEDVLSEVSVVDEQDLSASNLPSSVDLSASPYFPAVGDQKTEGSCSAWAAIYYAYGYMEAKQNGWTQASKSVASQLLSPAYTFNRVTAVSYVNSTKKYTDSGSGIGTNVYVTYTLGVATMSELPYVSGDYFNWGNESVQRSALYHEAASTTYILSDYVNTAKLALSNDAPVAFAINANLFTSAFADDKGSTFDISSSEYNSTSVNHAQCIVGYDDSYIEDGDVGAFKVVNSWGTSFGNNGYYWITYAAFEKMCAVSKPLFIVDKTTHNPTLVADLEFTTAPSRDGQIQIVLMDNSTNKITTTVYPTMRNQFYNWNFTTNPYRYPTTFIMDISAMTKLGSGAYNKIGYVLNQYLATQPITDSGSLKKMTIEKYITYNLNGNVYYSASTTGTSMIFIPGSSPADTIAPVTTLSVSGTQNNGWYSGITKFTLMATDASGIAYTYYRFSPSTVWVSYTGSVTLPDGVTKIEYYSADVKGNIESMKSTTVSVDSKSPVVNVVTTSQTTYTITLSAADAGSGVAGLFYKIDNGSYIAYSIPIVVVGTHTIYYYAIDNAGIQSTVQTVSVG